MDFSLYKMSLEEALALTAGPTTKPVGKYLSEISHHH